MNKIEITWTALRGFLNPFGSVFESLAEYTLGRVNAALDAIDANRREKVVAALNVADKAPALLNVIAFICPTRWQIAYRLIVEAVQTVCAALTDLQLTADELSEIRAEFWKAVSEWQSPDDETCADERLLEGAAK